MRTPLSLLLAFSLSGVAAAAGADQAVKLENQKVAGGGLSGTCGAATIWISDIHKDPIDSRGFSGSYAAITIQSGKSSLTISPDPNSGSTIFLQDRNKLHCVSTPAGPKLVLAMYCDGRSCAPVDYRVIEPRTAKVLNKLDNMDECDAGCAEQALGSRLPIALGEV